MTEESQTNPEMTSNNQIDSHSFDIDDNTFFSPQINPENIFCPETKDSSEIQFASKILCFPFNLDYFKLIFLKDEKDPELIDPFCSVILGDLEKVRYSESVLKIVFYSKDLITPLNLSDYPNEMKSLTNFPGIEFICICMNKMFIQCDDESTTKEAFNSLQKNYSSSDFLYDEDYSINSSENKYKGINTFSSEKKSNKDVMNFEDILSANKLGKKLDFFAEQETNNFSDQNNSKVPSSNNFKESDLFKRSIWDAEKKNKKEDIKSEDTKKGTNSTQQNTFNQMNPSMFSPQIFTPFIFPMNNLYKQKPQINPLLYMQYSKMNPYFLQTAFALQQNMIKFQQMNLKENGNKINFNGKNNNFNNETDKCFSSSNNKESSTNSNTSSTTSSKESSPASNYQDKTYSNVNLSNMNFGLFNGFNANMNSIQNLSINNNKLKNNKEYNNDLLNLSKASNINDNKCDKPDSFQKQDYSQINPNFDLQQIVINNTFKEYVPKNGVPNMPIIQNMNNCQANPQSPEKSVEFHTNSTRDYQYKYVSRYIVQIENEKNFPVTKMIIGNSGKLLRNILVKNCINNGDHTTKIRLRGRGSGYKEGPKNEESKDPMELCISSLNLISYIKCSQEIENLLKMVYYKYYLYEVENKKNNNKDNNNNELPINMKKILKYQYVVNRYNTLAKEEKRRKKEEELKQVNQINKNVSNNKENNNNFINHE